ncbi:DMT family transporter [Sphingomonas psychrotolerans]|uniref:DMT family transporter n=1 Tax=Sphingomonas psychrotolerans TaxID=1327635 RepID=A0ABU3N171_9SPHN|nr:DMT family transporter [Sphingomonas psychrotolerans]MDT8758295.1 DMT family transporter [Sphingomonas psychrotolerans]
MLWAGATIAAAAFQVGRNALQRGMIGQSGPWGATLVRFLFGLPFSLFFVGLAWIFTPDAALQFGSGFWWPALAGALAQVLATAALLLAMAYAGFAIGTALQQSSVPLAAIMGLLVFGDNLSLLGWSGVAATTIGLAILVWPRPAASEDKPVQGVLLGLASGLLFGFALNAFRHAGLGLEPRHPFLAAAVSVAVVQAVQAGALILYLLWRDRPALIAVIRNWRRSLGAGLFGALASSGWFFALNLAPAAAVRALGVIEMPIAALTGHQVFREGLNVRQTLAVLIVTIGVAMTAGF